MNEEPRFSRGFHLTRRENMSLGRPGFEIATNAGVVIAVLYGDQLLEHARALHYKLDWGQGPDDEHKAVVQSLMAKTREIEALRSPGIEGIAAERLRQIEIESFDTDNDDDYDRDELIGAALSYLWNHWFADGVGGRPPIVWPWEARWWKPKSRRRDLERAGALIAAELARMDRKEAQS